MSVKFIRVRQSVTSAHTYEVPIEENNGIPLVSLNRLIPNVQHLGYVTDDETIRVTRFENDWFFPPDESGWRSDMIYFGIVHSGTTESSRPPASNPSQEKFFSPDKDLTFYHRIYRWWSGQGYEDLKSE